jgi:ABC-type enterochelin transport system permease subunit
MKFLVALILVAVAYSVWFQQRQTLTGNSTVDGSVTVLLGLYICSRPAGNAIDLFFFERNSSHRSTAGWSSLSWLALNVLTLLMGWVVIYLGTMRLTSRAG